MKPYYQDEWVTQYCSDALKVLSGLEGDSVDLLATDPPYGISFMGKDWDKALPDIEVWKECLRVLKPGSFAFVMSIPRSDCLSRMIIAVEDAGFEVNFTPIFWAYASGFPKAQNIGKAVDKRLGAERVSLGAHPNARKTLGTVQICKKDGDGQLRPIPATPQAKALDGSYGGFQPKPAVEVIIVAMKPLSEKTFVDQALKNQKGITWLDDCRIPYESEDLETRTQRSGLNSIGKEYDSADSKEFSLGKATVIAPNQSGRFPANLLVSDDVLNDGRIQKDSSLKRTHKVKEQNDGIFPSYNLQDGLRVRDKDYGGGSGSFSRYFNLDKWWEERIKQLPELKTFPFLIVPKASKSEKNKGCEELEDKEIAIANAQIYERSGSRKAPQSNYLARKNNHPTVKPLKLMSYLITLGSRAGDTVLDPFGGSGTTALASKLLSRKCIISEIEEKYCEIAANRCRQMVFDLSTIKEG